MGKIFDALEKSKKERNTTVETNKLSGKVVTGSTKKQETSFNKDFSGKITTVISSEPRDQPENEKRRFERGGISVTGTEILYNDYDIDNNLVTYLKPTSFEAEQFKILRTNIFFPISGKPPRSIIVTSAIPAEGKSFVAANLAVSIAQSLDEHVLIIDCDIRRPNIHRQFGFGDVPGLSEHLSKGIPLSTLLLKTKVNKLNILPAGKPPHNPSELLSSQQMADLLEELKERYSDRYIIIDSPPPILTAETNAIIRMADGVLLVVEYGRTGREMVSNLAEKMGKEKLLGVVFNKCDMRFSGYYGFGKYSKYNKYYNSYK